MGPDFAVCALYAAYAGGYLPHPRPRAAYAAMIRYLDRSVGGILETLDELGLDHDTLVVFSSDNGTTYAGGCDRERLGDQAGRLIGLRVDTTPALIGEPRAIGGPREQTNHPSVYEARQARPPLATKFARRGAGQSGLIRSSW